LNNIKEIEIFGEKYSFKVDESESGSHTDRAVDFFISEIYRIHENIDEQINATKLVKLLLALMNITKKSLEIRKKIEIVQDKSLSFLTEIETKIDSL